MEQFIIFTKIKRLATEKLTKVRRKQKLASDFAA
nr:MAG TPA: hypothetical protein [Caudoviricetes sp.]